METRFIPAHLQIHGIGLVNLAMDEALAAIEAALASGQPRRIAFVNADCVNIAASNDNYRDHLAQMDWVFIDGIGMRIAGNILQQPVRENVNGTDLFPPLCDALARKNRSLYLLGARPGVAAAVADWALSHYPGLRIAGTQDGYYKADEEATIIARIRAAKPDVLLVALGAPRQEAWINRHMANTGATVALGVGGLFDYYSGRIPRAPLWMRRTGLEWVYRLNQEPGRLWRRYLIGNGIFLLRIAIDRLETRLGKPKDQRRAA